MSIKAFDKTIILLSYLSIILGFYYSGLSQSTLQEESSTPHIILLLPFAVNALQLLRLLDMPLRLDSLGKSWLWIFIYYIFAILLDLDESHPLRYHTAWFIICPPITWLYYSAITKNNQGIRNFLIKYSFRFFLIFSLISLYFIPRSVRDNGLFSYLNTGYYVLFAYPMVLLSGKRLPKIVATILMFIIIFLSLKRGGILAMTVGFVLYVLLSSKINAARKIIVTVAAGVILLFALPKINEYTNGSLQVRYEFTQNQGDDEGRAMMYPLVWKAVWSSSFDEIVMGHGNNAVVNDAVVFGNAAHNDYLEFLYDYGIIGLILLLLYQFRLYGVTRKSYKDDRFFFPAVFALSCIIVLSMVSIVYSFYYFLLIIPFWCVTNNQLNERG